MKLTPSILFSAILLTLPAFAAEEAKDATPAAKSSEADTAWAEIEALLSGPKEQPKSQEEAKSIFKQHLANLDEKSAAFRKNFPGDSRRWRLAMSDAETNYVRGAVGLPSLNAEQVKKLLADVLAAADADKSVKASASFGQVMTSRGDEAEFKKLAQAHIAAYPDFKGNPKIQSLLKEITADAEADAELKKKPLDIKFTATNGAEVDIAKMAGKVVLVDFWATWCGPCMAEVPNVLAVYNKLHDKGFEIVGISFDNDKVKMEKVTKDKGMVWPQYFDGKGWKNEYGQKYGINSIPRMWLVNKKGMLVDTNGRQDLEKKVEKLLAE